jgi:hypothetical protein
MIITWPSLNQLMAVLDGTVANLASTNLLQQNAYFQTWLCLFSCIVTTMGLRVHGERISLDQVIPSIINVIIFIILDWNFNQFVCLCHYRSIRFYSYRYLWAIALLCL